MPKILFFCWLVLQCTIVFAENADQIKLLAGQGDGWSQAKLASLYLLGRDGMPKDEKLAAEWMEKAANQGVLDAQVAVAAMYDRGMGVPNDREKSTYWYEKAAAKGHDTSLAILGKNDAAKGSVQFNYQAMRLSASKTIPIEYAKRFLNSK